MSLSKQKVMRFNKWSPKGKCFDLLSNSPNLVFNEMYGDQFGELVSGY